MAAIDFGLTIRPTPQDGSVLEMMRANERFLQSAAQHDLTQPCVPSTAIACPEWIRDIASRTVVTAGMAYLRASIAPRETDYQLRPGPRQRSSQPAAADTALAGTPKHIENLLNVSTL